jgi:hypothetical protein
VNEALLGAPYIVRAQSGCGGGAGCVNEAVLGLPHLVPSHCAIVGGVSTECGSAVVLGAMLGCWDSQTICELRRRGQGV